MTELHVVLRYDPDFAPDFDGDITDMEVAIYDALTDSAIGTNLVEVEFTSADVDDWPTA